MTSTSMQLVERQAAELEETSAIMDGLAQRAADEGRDLTDAEWAAYNEQRSRLELLSQRIAPMQDAVRIMTDARARTATLQEQIIAASNPFGAVGVNYRSAGEYIGDLYAAATNRGDDGARRRLDVYHRAAAHQTTADNPGLLPEKIVGPLVNFVDTRRPIAAAVGVTPLGNGSWAYAKVTQHTLVGPQPGEKQELPSRKMTVTKTPIAAPLLGGYVNVSRQDISRTSPGIVDMVLKDLAGQYARETEDAAIDALIAGGTAGGSIPSTGATQELVLAAVWAASMAAHEATEDEGSTIGVVSTDVANIIGPMFPPNANAGGSSFLAGGVGSGQIGTVSGVPHYLARRAPAGTYLVLSTAAAESFEESYSNMQVGEPAVWGVQVGYAGGFATVVYEPEGVQKITVEVGP